MSKILYAGTYGSDDPTRATMPFLFAAGALDKGYDAEIALMGEAVILMKEGVIDALHGVGFPPLKQITKMLICRHLAKNPRLKQIIRIVIQPVLLGPFPPKSPKSIARWLVN